MAFEQIPDVIISDVMMPGMDGFEVCRILKEDERTSHIPIILLTARVDDLSRIEGLKQGADAYLAKPFNQEELLVRLENMLEIRRKIKTQISTTTFPSSIIKIPEINQQQSYSTEHSFMQKVIDIIEAELRR